MKFWQVIAVFILIPLISTPCALAKSPFNDKQALYDHFNDPALYKNMFFEAKDISQWLSKECASPDKKCRTALETMRQPFSQWNSLDATNSFHSVINCRELTSVSHPNPALSRIMGKPIIHSLRDINGKLWLLALCDGLGENPDGIWNAQFSSWCRSITGMNEVWIINYLIQVPGTDYQILSHIPYKPLSIKDLKTKVKEFNRSTAIWTKEWNTRQNEN